MHHSSKVLDTEYLGRCPHTIPRYASREYWQSRIFFDGLLSSLSKNGRDFSETKAFMYDTTNVMKGNEVRCSEADQEYPFHFVCCWVYLLSYGSNGQSGNAPSINTITSSSTSSTSFTKQQKERRLCWQLVLSFHFWARSHQKALPNLLAKLFFFACRPLSFSARWIDILLLVMWWSLQQSCQCHWEASESFDIASFSCSRPPIYESLQLALPEIYQKFNEMCRLARLYVSNKTDAIRAAGDDNLSLLSLGEEH